MTPPNRNGGAATPPSDLALGEGRPVDSAPLDIRLFGEFDLRLGETSLPRLDSARAESLLAYLLLHREAAQPRQRLAFLLWPDSSEAQARTNLRHVLHNLRRGLPDADRYLEVGTRTLRWRTEEAFRLDVAAFEEALARAEAAGAEGALPALRDAVATYNGDLLEGCYDEWLLDDRERLRERFLDALARLADLLARIGEHAQAIPHAERLVRQDPLREESYRLLMRLYDARGDRARALRVYHECTATLERELGVEPSASTREAYEALLPVAPEPAARAGTAGRLAGPVLVGRAAERAQLSAAWRASERGRAQLALVTGEAGIGKTRLVDELRSWCSHRGALTAEARSYAAEGALAYGPVAAWLRSETLSVGRGRLDRGRLSELSRLLPELAVEPGLAPPPPLPESEQRQRLFDALLRAILAAETPLLLVADDLHWADPETLGFLHYLMRSEPEARLLVAATARSDELHLRHPLNHLLAGLRSLERLVELELSPLSRQETAVLAERLFGSPLGDQDADRLFVETAGNPLFVVETLRAGWTGEQSQQPWMSPKVQGAIESRLSQLSGAARDLVEVAATIGREFSSELLAAAAGSDAEALVPALDELWRRRIVREQGSESYDFTHDKIREVADVALGPARRRRLHLRVARALERLHADDPASVSARLASHYDRAGAADDAVRWYATAAEAAQRLHANADAVRSLERALELARGLPDDAERAALELTLLTALPAPLVSVEGYLSDRMAAVHERAVELGAALGVEPEPPLVRSLALATLTRGDFEAARPFGEQLRARAERDGDDVLWVESAYVLGIAAYWQGRLEEARAHFEDAVARYRPEQRTAHLVRYGQDPRVFCEMRLAHTLWLLGHANEAEQARDEALALAGRVGHPYSRAGAVTFAALLALDQGDEERLRRYAHGLASTSLYETGPTPLGAEAFAGYVDVLDGRAREGLERIRRIFAAARDGGAAAPGHPGFLVRLLLEACLKAGKAAEGLATADEALRTGGGAQLWEAEVRRLRAGFLTALGAPPDEVEAELARAVDVARRQGARSFELRARESLDRLHAARR